MRLAPGHGSLLARVVCVWLQYFVVSCLINVVVGDTLETSRIGVALTLRGCAESSLSHISNHWGVIKVTGKPPHYVVNVADTAVEGSTKLPGNEDAESLTLPVAVFSPVENTSAIRKQLQETLPKCPENATLQLGFFVDSSEQAIFSSSVPLALFLNRGALGKKENSVELFLLHWSVDAPIPLSVRYMRTTPLDARRLIPPAYRRGVVQTPAVIVQTGGTIMLPQAIDHGAITEVSQAVFVENGRLVERVDTTRREQVSEPSFLQKYWWVIVLGFVAVNLLSTNEVDNAGEEQPQRRVNQQQPRARKRT